MQKDKKIELDKDLFEQKIERDVKRWTGRKERRFIVHKRRELWKNKK